MEFINKLSKIVFLALFLAILVMVFPVSIHSTSLVIPPVQFIAACSEGVCSEGFVVEEDFRDKGTKLDLGIRERPILYPAYTSQVVFELLDEKGYFSFEDGIYQSVVEAACLRKLFQNCRNEDVSVQKLSDDFDARALDQIKREKKIERLEAYKRFAEGIKRNAYQELVYGSIIAILTAFFTMWGAILMYRRVFKKIGEDKDIVLLIVTQLIFFAILKVMSIQILGDPVSRWISVSNYASDILLTFVFIELIFLFFFKLRK